MLATASQTKNETNGNGQFGSLTRRRKNNNKKQDNKFITSENLEDYSFIGKSERRMRFNNSKDPIYYVFDVIENRPIKKLAKEFVKDILKDTFNFVSEMVVG